MADQGYENEGATGEERAGFCQHCGRPLTRSTVRQVGKAIFCDVCVQEGASAGAAGQAGTAAGNATNTTFGGGVTPRNAGGWQGVPPGYVAPLPVADAPSPVLAGFLGLIPGVGAMYNGQIAKGFIHLVVFAVLVSLANNVNGIFGVFVTGWTFYMAFEAYHTAKARRDGLPLPDPFGWNNIGDRMGFGKNWPGSPTVPNPGPQGPAWPSGQPAQPDWVGYVPPTHFAGVPPAPGATSVPPVAGPPVPPPPAAAAWGTPYQAPYQTPYTSPVNPAAVPYADVSAAGTVPVAVPTRRFPVGAMWLIGLGLLFLIGNFAPSLRLSWRWIWPIVFAALSIWLFVRRMGWAGGTGYTASGRRLGVVCDLRAPVLLMTAAVLFALQSAYVFTLGQTWPVFFIVLGALLLLERTVGRSAYQPAAVLDSDQGVSGPDSGEWAAADATKGGR